jgi:hypothetical protein
MNSSSQVAPTQALCLGGRTMLVVCHDWSEVNYRGSIVFDKTACLYANSVESE